MATHSVHIRGSGLWLSSVEIHCGTGGDGGNGSCLTAWSLCCGGEETLHPQATQFSLKCRPEEADRYPHAPWRGTVEYRLEEAPQEGTHKPVGDHRSCGSGRLA